MVGDPLSLWSKVCVRQVYDLPQSTINKYEIKIVKLKTQLGNQLSSYAALLYFALRHGYHAFLDPTQTKAIGQVFKKERLGIGTFDFYRCGCVPGAQHWLHLLELDRTGVALRLRDDPGKYSRDHLVGLGAHSVPLFLIKGELQTVLAAKLSHHSEVLGEVRERLVFKDKILLLATNILRNITERSDKETVVVVGVHARRGDKLRVWRQSGLMKDNLGRYEGKFFRRSMEGLRDKYNSESREVVFIVTSDNIAWTKTQLGNHSDTFFSGDFLLAPPSGHTSLGVDLALLSLANHTIMDYGTFGLWGGLLAGGDIIAPTGYTRGSALSPDLVWWRAANMSSVHLVQVEEL